MKVWKKYWGQNLDFGHENSSKINIMWNNFETKIGVLTQCAGHLLMASSVENAGKHTIKILISLCVI